MEKRLTYFDNAATVWPKPESVYKFMDQFYLSLIHISYPYEFLSVSCHAACV